MEELYKKDLNELDYYDGVISMQSQTFWSAKSSETYDALQCSCLENPRERGACWAVISGVTHSQT